MRAAHEAGVIAAGAAWASGARVAELKEAHAAEFLAWLDGKTRQVKPS